MQTDKTSQMQQELDNTIKPGDDFYSYVNQKWIAGHPIPDSKSRVGAFTVLNDENVDRLKKLLEQEPRANESANTARVKALYRSIMDRAAIEKAGLTPLQPILQAIAELDTPDLLKAFIGDWHGRGLSLLWRIDLDVDSKNSQRYVISVNQSGLGLPDRDYYFEDGERFETIRTQYHAFLTDMLQLLGEPAAARQAKRIYQLEKKLAAASNTAVEQRDVVARYNLYRMDQLADDFSALDWPAYIKKTGFAVPDELIVAQPKFLRTALDLLGSQPLETWRSYLMVRCLTQLMPTLPKAYEQLHFSFYGKALSGAKEQEPRFRRAISMCEQLLPEPIGQLFVETYFDETAKARIYDLVDHVQAALRERIKELPWMTGTTKKRALEKLDTFVPLLGYPDTWKDYTALELHDSCVENFLAVLQFSRQYDTARLKKPVDRKEWLMSPAMVNAYYWPNTNGITFPAAILQPPFFDARGDFAANYGGIGAVIGHEITHGFDDKGSEFDQDGNMQSWWAPEDRAAFETRAKQLEVQYNAYEIGGRHVNGALTLGENIADLGGMLIAYDALQRELEETKQTEVIDGFTPEQRFFIAQARIWREHRRPELALRLLVSDPHSPPDLRVNAVASNLDAFYDAFDVQPGDKLYKTAEERVRIW